MTTVRSFSFSISISTSSPTETGLVEVMSSILKTPFMRAFQNLPVSSFTVYQLPVDLYTRPFMIVRISPFFYDELPSRLLCKTSLVHFLFVTPGLLYQYRNI